MARALAYAHRTANDPLDLLRMVIVCGCAYALIVAGQALPALI